MLFKFAFTQEDIASCMDMTPLEVSQVRLVEETARTWISTKDIQITLQGEGVRVRECIVKI